MRIFGLIGYPLSHSFSQEYFTRKFNNDNITDCAYKLFPIASIKELPNLLNHEPNLCGLNVTIPYKEQIIPYLDDSDEVSSAVGAVNTVKIVNNRLTGYNTDVYGFEESIKPILKAHHTKALILGSGGASKAVRFVLNKLNISFKIASRNQEKGIKYGDISHEFIKQRPLIINTTPLGMYPYINEYPDIPYAGLTPEHLLYDLIYNPSETIFLKKGKVQGCIVKNGLEMLHLQAEGSWKIFGV